jgi:hypothetical protein
MIPMAVPARRITASAPTVVAHDQIGRVVDKDDHVPSGEKLMLN